MNRTPIEHLVLQSVPDEAVSPTKIEEKKNEEVEESEIGEKRNPTIDLFGRELDVDSTVVMVLILLIWIVIWFYSGLWKTLQYDPSFSIIFFLFIAYVLANLATSGTTSGGVVYELNILLSVEQMVSILFGTIVLFALFNNRLDTDETCRSIVSKLSVSIVVILATASLWVNIYTSGRAFRAVRKFKQGIYNISLTLFIVIGLLFLKNTPCKSKIVSQQNY